MLSWAGKKESQRWYTPCNREIWIMKFGHGISVKLEGHNSLNLLLLFSTGQRLKWRVHHEPSVNHSLDLYIKPPNFNKDKVALFMLYGAFYFPLPRSINKYMPSVSRLGICFSFIADFSLLSYLPLILLWVHLDEFSRLALFSALIPIFIKAYSAIFRVIGEEMSREETRKVHMGNLWFIVWVRPSLQVPWDH